MTTCIEQIAISGIRSFNPDVSQRQGLRFQKPVTIILGPNGSGKTTVIEALRNACTGEVPANTGKGAAFVHDPKIAGETEVKAQIKLQFRTATGQQMLIGRSYQLTQMANNKQKFETLDVSLQTRDPKTGDTVSQSYKCGDLDKLVPDLLGISKPILDNVIFLHQDDTNWPLAEAAKLKKKFDDIFSSTRYTKALEEIRKVMKENKERIKEHTANLAVFKEKRSVAHGLRAQIDDTQKKIQTANEHMKSIDVRIDKIQAQIEETGKQADEIQQLESDAIKLQGTVEALVQQREVMGRALQVISEESDEKLQEALSKFDKVFTELRNNAAKCEEKLKSLNAELKRDDDIIVKMKSEKEFLVAQGHEHQRKIQNLQYIIAEAARIHGIQLPVVSENKFEEREILKFFDTFTAKVEELKGQREQVRTEARRAQEDIEKLLSDCRQKRDLLTANHRAIEVRNEQSRPKLRDLKDRFNMLSAADQEYEDAKKRKDELEKAYKESQVYGDTTSLQLNELREKHVKLQNSCDTLKAEARSRREEQEAAHKLKMLRDEKGKKEKEEADMKSVLESKYTQLVGRKILSNYYEDISQSIEAKKAAIAKAQKHVTQTDREVAIARQQMDQTEMTRKRTLQDITNKEAQYTDLTKEYGKSLPELLRKAEAKEEHDAKALATMKALQMCYDNFTQQGEEDECCPICARAMNESELSVMTKHVRQKLQSVPATIAKKEEALSKAQQLVKKARNLHPVYNDVTRLKKELDDLEKKRAAHSDTYETQLDTLKDLTAKLEALKFEEMEFSGLLRSAEKIKDVHVSVVKLGDAITIEEEKIAAQHGSGVRPLDLVTRDINTMQEQMDGIIKQQQQLMSDAEEKRKASAKILQQLQNATAVVTEKSQAIDERNRLRQEHERVLEDFTKGNAEIAAIKSELPKLEEDVAKYTAELSTKREAGDRAEKEITQQVEQHQNDLSRVSAHVHDIKNYIAEKKGEKTEELIVRLIRLDEAQKEKQHRIEATEHTLGEINRKVTQQDMTRRELEANLQYRAKCKDVKEGELKLHKLKMIIKDRTKGHEGVWMSLDKLREEKARHDTEKATYAGQVQANETLLREKQKELFGTKYDRIDERYNSTLIRLATAQITEEDLSKYSVALDSALMKYHDEKIKEINEIIKDLWARTYRGQDIDYIELRSDVEATTARSRNYNYRVVMIKGGVALDMRGRCSAGQKVLASLVVRLALSQAFCCDCGILALDEPTTNLDVENIDSLAYALTEIIEARRGQSNFQLIIITHDEQFVRRIGNACGTETVYHISKDIEGAYSTITERRFAELM